VRRGGTINDTLVPQLTEALPSSKRLIVFLTPEFLASKWPFWELMTYWDMMENESTANPTAEHKKIIYPISYRISAKNARHSPLQIQRLLLPEMLLERIPYVVI
jgi:hypothetical protein